MDVQAGIPFHGCTTVAGVSAGTTTTLTTANAQLLSFLGKIVSRAAGTNEATPTTDFVTGVTFVALQPNKGSVFLVGSNSSGTMGAIQGSIEDVSNQNQFLRAPQFGPMPPTFVAYAYIVVKLISTASAWTFGASNFAGPPTGVTFTIVNIATVPSRPQVS